MRYDQDIGKQDRGIEAEAADRLQCDLRRPFGVKAEIEKARRFSAYTSCLTGLNVAFSRVIDRLSRFLMITAPGYFHLHLISDSTGETFVRPHSEKIKRAGALLICQVQTLEQVREAVSNGADVLVAQGAEGGGHGIARSTFPLVPAVVDAAPDVPVAAEQGRPD